VVAAGGVDHDRYHPAMTYDDKADLRGKLDLTGAVWEPMLPEGLELPVYAERAMVKHTDGVTYILLRQSNDRDGVMLIFTPPEWEAFGLGVADGEFDLPS
jgi:hypothetical protein